MRNRNTHPSLVNRDDVPTLSGKEVGKGLGALLLILLLNLVALAAVVFTVVKVLQWTGVL